jgi:2-polyprenyl-3-methyl-5-hydroxy-6-metoxy-1,4-benzoquinol methylase
MNTRDLEEARRALIDRHGAWAAANIDLGGGVFTIDPAKPTFHGRMARFSQAISDLTARPMSALRILDLGCGEGEYAIEFARRGAEVLGIEGRTANLAKARFAQEALGLKSLQFAQDDVRNVSREKYGLFDAIICSGILYHLDAPDVVVFLERLFEVCRGSLIVDTHVSGKARESFAHHGKTFSGSSYIEHHRRASTEELEQSLWSSLDNRSSFWLTRPSLYNALTAAGFTSVFEVHAPPVLGASSDRITLAAVKGTPYGAPEARAVVPWYWPESQLSDLGYRTKKRAREIAMRLPYPVARLIQRMFSRFR